MRLSHHEPRLCRIIYEMNVRSFFIIILKLLVSCKVHAGERYEFYNGIRQLGMGGAGIAVVNDETSMLVNPAGLGKLRDFIFTVADPEIEGTNNALPYVSENLLESFQPQPLLDELKTTENRGTNMHLKAQMFPSLVVQNFGLGVYGRYSADGEVNQANTEFTLDYYNDYALVTAMNFRLFEGVIKLGANARAVNRVQINRTNIPANSTNLTVDSLASEGFGFATDVGLIITAPIVLLPTISAVWRDVGNTTYNLKEGMFTSAISIPDHTPQVVDVAMAIFPILGHNSRMVITAEYRDIMTASEETDHMRRAHAGVEFNIADAFFIRGGMNQRYWTAGLEIQMFNYQIQFASYGEEIGTADEPEESRRYAFKFAFRF